jgi:GxxExxY protein
MEINEITGIIVDSAMKVHSALGPGLLESVYERCLVHELHKRGLRTASQVPLPVIYDGELIEGGYRVDILVEDVVIVELKAAESLIPLYSAQLYSYLKLSDKRVGLLINFNTTHLRHGIRRVINSRRANAPATSASSAPSATNPSGS